MQWYYVRVDNRRTKRLRPMEACEVSKPDQMLDVDVVEERARGRVLLQVPQTIHKHLEWFKKYTILFLTSFLFLNISSLFPHSPHNLTTSNKTIRLIGYKSYPFYISTVIQRFLPH